MKKLVIYTQMEKGMYDVISFGVHLAHELEMCVTLMHIIDDENENANSQNKDENLSGNIKNIKKITAADAFLKNSLAKLKVENPILPEIKIKIKTGNMQKLLKAEVAEQENTMLLLAGNQSDNFMDYLLRNVHLVLENIHVPTIIVPPGMLYKGITKIVYADKNKQLNTNAMVKLIELFSLCHPVFFGLHLSENTRLDESSSVMMQKRLKEENGYDKIVLLHHQDKYTASAIAKYAEEFDASLIAIGKDDKTFLRRIFGQNVSDRIIKSAQVPVCVL